MFANNGSTACLLPSGGPLDFRKVAGGVHLFQLPDADPSVDLRGAQLGRATASPGNQPFPPPFRKNGSLRPVVERSERTVRSNRGSGSAGGPHQHEA